MGGPNAVSDNAAANNECASAPPPPSNPGDTKNCTDFATWSQAQSWFNTYYPYYREIAKRDGDNDGIACESFPGAPKLLIEHRPLAVRGSLGAR